MATSRQAGPTTPPSGSCSIPPRTPGTLGINDQGDPNVTTLLGDTPGCVGLFDGGDPTLPQYCGEVPYSALVCKAPDGKPLSVATTPPAPLPADQDAEVYVSKDYASTTKSVGTGYCVPLVQNLAGVPSHDLWIEGASLDDRPELEPGTAIATFDENGQYPSNAKGNHAALFVRYDPSGDPATAKGIYIFDQYREWADSAKNYGKDWQKQKKGEDDAAFQARVAEVKKNFPEEDPVHGRFRRKQPGERFIPFDADSKSPSNNASAFSVIQKGP
jgi:hypothetical protein